MFPPQLHHSEPDPEPDDRRADLDWVAFRYLTGELAEIDRLDFEERMADDQEAREALAAAVELAGAIRQAEAGRRRRAGTWSRWALVAAASVIGVVCWIGPDQTPRASAGEVALAWSDLRQPAFPTTDETAVPSREDDATDDPADVPGWLIDVLEAGESTPTPTPEPAL